MKRFKKLLASLWLLVMIVPITVVGIIFAVMTSMYHLDAQAGIDFWKDNF